MKYKIRRLIALMILAICLGIVFYMMTFTNKAEVKEEKKTVSVEEVAEDTAIVPNEEIVPDTTISLVATGDIMCHNSQYNDAAKNGTYDFSYVFEDVTDIISSADVAIGNLETTFAGKERGYSSYPTFNTPEQLATNLKDAGFDILTTANNHSLDTGYKGIEGTIANLDEVGILHTGTFDSPEKKDEILIKNVNGINIAVLSYTYGTNGIPVPKGKEYCINLIDKDLIKTHLDKAKELKPDLIIVSMHWGEEYLLKPNKEQNELADFLFENGADIILGSHPHVLEKMEKREIELEDGTKKDGFVIFSLGNFVSGQKKANTRNSIILSLKITKNGQTGKMSIDETDYTPIYTYTYPNLKNYRIIDLRERVTNYENGTDDLIKSSDYKTLKSELEHVDKIMNEE